MFLSRELQLSQWKPWGDRHSHSFFQNKTGGSGRKTSHLQSSRSHSWEQKYLYTSLLLDSVQRPGGFKQWGNALCAFWDHGHPSLGKAGEVVASHLLLVPREVEWQGKAPLSFPDWGHPGLERAWDTVALFPPVDQEGRRGATAAAPHLLLTLWSLVWGAERGFAALLRCPLLWRRHEEWGEAAECLYCSLSWKQF